MPDRVTESRSPTRSTDVAGLNPRGGPGLHWHQRGSLLRPVDLPGLATHPNNTGIIGSTSDLRRLLVGPVQHRQAEPPFHGIAWD
jgi:hypothetical protein